MSDLHSLSSAQNLDADPIALIAGSLRALARDIRAVSYGFQSRAQTPDAHEQLSARLWDTGLRARDWGEVTWSERIIEISVAVKDFARRSDWSPMTDRQLATMARALDEIAAAKPRCTDWRPTSDGVA